MATLSYNIASSTVSFGDIATLTIGQAQIVNGSASELHVRTTISGTINGTLDVIFTGNFSLIGGLPAGGSFTGLEVDFNNDPLLKISNFTLSLSATQSSDFNGIVGTIMGGDDVVTGAALGDVLQGFAGADSIDAGGGVDIVNGNQGNDTVIGGDGDDVLRGGKDNDSVSGGAGNDFIAGDRGSDTLAGGAGADTFHTFTGAGIDRVVDFNVAEGDRVMLFSGTTYTVSQSGADVVIDLGGGDQMILVGVQQSSLTGAWLFTI